MRPAQKAPENEEHSECQLGGHAGFNEAGAKSAGKQVLQNDRLPREGYASMRPAQKAPENSDESEHCRLLYRASMRPAQKAPENRVDFNLPSEYTSSFNEAGAKSAGKRLPADRFMATIIGASMRPAQKAPENNLTNLDKQY